MLTDASSRFYCMWGPKVAKNELKGVISQIANMRLVLYSLGMSMALNSTDGVSSAAKSLNAFLLAGTSLPLQAALNALCASPMLITNAYNRPPEA